MIGTSRVRVAAHAGEVQPEVVAGGLLQLGGGVDVRACGMRLLSACGVWTRTLASIIADSDEEDRGADHVHLRRHADARRAPDEERERDLAARS